MTRLGTGKSLSSGSEFESRRSEFECRRLDPVSIGLEFVSVVHKGVMERNILAHRGTPCTHTKVLQVFHGQIEVGDIHYLLFLLSYFPIFFVLQWLWCCGNFGYA